MVTHTQRLNHLMLHKKTVSAPPSIHLCDTRAPAHLTGIDAEKTHRTSSSFRLKMNRTPAPYSAVPDAEQPKRQGVWLSSILAKAAPKHRDSFLPWRSQGHAENWAGARHMPHHCHPSQKGGKVPGGQDLCQHKPP